METINKQNTAEYLKEENERKGRGFNATDLAKILVEKGILKEEDIK